MPRVDDGRENVIDDTIHDLPRLPGMDAEGRRLWFNSLGDRERKELLEACSTYIGIAIGAPWANLFKRWSRRR